MDLKNKIAVVTGAGSGLGAACSVALAARGARVFGIGRNKPQLLAAGETLGKCFVPVQLDITNEPAVSRWVKEVFTGTVFPSVLINNAGKGRFGDIESITTEEWQDMISTNLSGAFYVTRSIVPLMRLSGKPGHVINIGSVLAKTTRSGASAYCATKFGMLGFSEALSRELRVAGIKVTCVNPGSMATGFFRQSGIEPHSNMLHPDDIARLIVTLLETPDNFLVDEITVRPLNPDPPVERKGS